MSEIRDSRLTHPGQPQVHALRTVFRITFNRWRRAWVASVNGAPVSCGRQKAALIKQVARECVWMHELLGHDSQLVIQGRNGRIQCEYTYGNDPRRSKG